MSSENNTWCPVTSAVTTINRLSKLYSPPGGQCVVQQNNTEPKYRRKETKTVHIQANCDWHEFICKSVCFESTVPCTGDGLESWLLCLKWQNL